MSGKVPPSSRAKSRLRVRFDENEVRKAALLFERFTGHQLQSGQVFDVPDIKTCVVIGTCDGILYTTKRDGRVEHYKHEFAASDKPVFAVSPDGRQLILLGGRYRFTARGIVDASDRSR